MPPPAHVAHAALAAPTEARARPWGPAALWQCGANRPVLPCTRSISAPSACILFSACALQAALDEVYEAFVAGSAPPPGNYTAASCIPAPLPPGKGSYQPLFLWDGTQLTRRSDINNLRDTERIDHEGFSGWWSATTLAKLELKYGPPSNLPPKPNGQRPPRSLRRVQVHS